MLVGPPAMVGLFYGGDMGKYDKIDVGEKLPGTYCPVCGEDGLRKMIFDNTEWAVCPIIEGESAVKKLKDAHTGYMISTRAKSAAPKVESFEKKEEGVKDA